MNLTKRTLRALACSQAALARLLCVSTRSVERWAGGHETPTGPAHVLLTALAKAPHAAAILADNSDWRTAPER